MCTADRPLAAPRSAIRHLRRPLNVTANGSRPESYPKGGGRGRGRGRGCGRFLPRLRLTTELQWEFCGASLSWNKDDGRLAERCLGGVFNVSAKLQTSSGLEGGGSAAAAAAVISRPSKTITLQFTAWARKIERIAQSKPDHNLTFI